MKNEDENANQIGLQQTNSIFQVWRQLKNSIFNVLFVLLNQSDDGQDQSIIGLSIETGLDYFQMMSFPFNTAVIVVWNGGQTLSAFTSIFTNLSFSKFIPGVGFSTFLIMLYLLIVVIILVILDIVYVSYSFSKKKFKYTWPLQFLARVVPLCVTVFFLPIMETLLSVVSCQNSEQMKGLQVMESFPDIVCWEGWHMFHAVITLFFTSIFVFIASIVALTIFEPRMSTNRLTARQNSSGQVIFIINKMVCQFVFSFTPFDNTWIYSIMLFSLSGWLWISYNVNQPFYNKNASKFFRICSTYYFWTNCMLFASRVLLDFGFQGGLVVWICGLPFIGISILFQRKSNIEKVFSSNLKFRSGQQLQSHLQYVLQLIHNRDKDKNSYMLLLGYIEKHIEVCMEEDCPLRVKKLKKQQDLPEIQENCRQLVKQLLRMYKEGVKKYPNCTKLRLSFAFFYMEKLQSNNKAYEEFSIAQDTEPSFGEQFIIYRFKKIIRQNLQQNDEDDDKDLIQIIRFDSHVSLCEEAMLMSARLHKDFWAQLEQETPDLKKLNSIGSRITQTSLKVKQNFKQVQKINNNVSEVIHNYAIYLIFIGQSHIQGKKILQQAKRIYFQKKKTEQTDMAIFTLKNSEYGNLTNIQQSFNSLIKVSIEAQYMGKIIYANNAFTELTGYIKEDITERTIDKVLPSVYLFHHMNAIKMWLDDVEKKVMVTNNTYMMKPHNGFVRQKSGFILPINYRVSFNTQQNCFLAIMRPDPTAYTDFNCKIYIITNAQGLIKDISPLGFMFFRIDNDFHVQQLGVTSYLNNEQLFLKGGVNVRLRQSYTAKTYKSNTFTQKNILTDNEVEHSVTNIQSSIWRDDGQYEGQEFNIHAEEIWINANQDIEQVIDDQGLYSNGKLKVGYMYILEKIRLDMHLNQNKQMNIQLNVFQHLFDEMYQEDKNYIFQDIDDPLQANRQRKSKILAEMLIDMNNGQALTFEDKKFRNYGEQLRIKTYRYFNNDYVRIYNIEYENSQNNQFQYENDELCGKKDVEKLQNRHFQDKVKQAINTSIQHEQIICLRKYSLLFFLVLCGLSVLSFTNALSQFQKIQTFTNLNYKRSKDAQFISKIIQKSIDCTKNKYTQQQLNATLKQLRQYRLTFDPAQNVYSLLQNGRLQSKSLLQAMNVIQARTINYFDSQSVSKNISISYQNYLLSVYPFLQEFSYESNVDITILIILTALALLNSLLMLLVWIFNIMKIDQKRFDIMIWFLDIPIDYIVYLENNCNRFIKNYVSIEELQDRGIHMDDKQHYCDQFQQKKINDDEQLDEQNKARKIMIARHRKKTFLSRFNCGYLTTLWILGYSSLIPSIFSVYISQEKHNFQFINQKWRMVNKQFMWSNAFPISLSLQTLGYEGFSTSKETVNLAQLTQSLRLNFLNALTKHDKVNDIKLLIQQNPQIQAVYSKAYYGDLCQLVSSLQDSNGSLGLRNQCQQILNNKLRAGITIYQSYLVNYNTSQIQQIARAQYKFVGPAMIIILTQWKDYFLSQIGSYKTYSNIYIYLYIAFTFIGYVSLWMMYLRNENTKMNQTIQMLNMIPMKMLPKNRKDTREFLNWLIQQANKRKQVDDD